MTSPSPLEPRPAIHARGVCVCVCCVGASVSTCHFLGENRTGSRSESRQQTVASPPQGSLSPPRERKRRDVCVRVCPQLTPAFRLQRAGLRKLLLFLQFPFSSGLTIAEPLNTLRSLLLFQTEVNTRTHSR